jgi:hypothetical protein
MVKTSAGILFYPAVALIFNTAGRYKERGGQPTLTKNRK